jgi:hypothetical protein
LRLGPLVLTAPEADRLRLAEALLEHDLLGLRPTCAKRRESRLTRTTEATHGLCRVARGDNVPVPGDHTEHRLVGAARILELVDEEMAEPRRHLLGHILPVV